jgi:hypothetical protein
LFAGQRTIRQVKQAALSERLDKVRHSLLPS